MTTDQHPGGSGVSDSLDRYARMVRRAVGAPVALVSIVEEGRQVFPGAVGLPEAYQRARETPLTHSFCQYVVADAAPLVIEDARTDERLRHNLAIPDLGVVAYAGWPLTDLDGATIGSVCAIHPEPHAWTREELDALSDIAEACSVELAQRELRRRALLRAQELAAVSTSSRLLLALSERLATTRTPGDVSEAVERVAREQLGCLHAGLWLRLVTDPSTVPDVLPPQPNGWSEPLTFVDHPAGDWAQARTHARLAIADDNPLGTAILTDRLVVLDDLDELAARHPHLAGPVQVGGTRAYMPLEVDGSTYGALALVWPAHRHLSDDDRMAIAALRSYTAQAVQRALLFQERVQVAVTLQNAMLTQLPQPDHLQIAARYLPAAARDQVGGDWYDAVVMPDGTTHVAVGDVVGHDIGAAAVMGQLRGMLRTFAWSHSEPDDTPRRLVERLDRACSGLGIEALATLVHARVEQTPADREAGLRTLRWTNAGHLSPLLLHPDGRVEPLEDLGAGALRDCMIGVAPERDRHDRSVSVPAGATLLLFTDGLVERRGETIDDGLDRAVRTVGELAGLALEDLLDELVERLVGGAADDDVAVLAVRFHSEAEPRPEHQAVDPLRHSAPASRPA